MSKTIFSNRANLRTSMMPINDSTIGYKRLPAVVAPGGLENPRFARKPSELLQLELEVFNEPN